MTTPGNADPDIRLAIAADAPGIAALWATCQPDSVWVSLGPRLSTIHFRSFCEGGHELAVTAWLGGLLAGACLGTDRPADYGRAVYAEHGAELARAFAREVVSRPSVALALAARVRRGLQGAREGGGARPADALAELRIPLDRAAYMSDFFVSPSARGHHLGTLMLNRFCDEMASRGREACIVHTTAENVASQVAQTRAGFECVLRQGADLTFLRRIDR